MSAPFLGGRIEPREYQIEIFNTAREYNTLVVLPTGLGKTIIAALVAEYVITEKKEKVMFLAPTRPLVNQHLETFNNLFNPAPGEISAFTGEVDSEDRLLKWVTSRIIISTPQVAENDLKVGLYDISKFGLIIFDEAHRATGNYSYVEIATHFLEVRKRLILGMTASPGADREKLDSITKSLGIERIIIKSEDDPDVRKYVGGISLDVIKLELPPEVRDLVSLLRQTYSTIIDHLRNAGVINSKSVTRSELAKKISEIASRARSGETKLFGLIQYISAAIRADYLMEYIETQGVEIAADYLREIMNGNEKTLRKTASILQKIPEFTIFMERMREIEKLKPENPKMLMALRLCEETVSKNPESRIIIFTHFRKTSDLLTDYLSSHSPLLRPIRFIGQSSRGGDSGIRQKDQDMILQKFRANIYNVLVATSVAEEGLDVPSTDLVIFFEPVPSEIRSIQRRGRTGRTHAGSVKILIYNNTRDAAYYYSSIRKENRMLSNIKKAASIESQQVNQRKTGNPSLDDFIN